MNKIFRIVWNRSIGQWTVVSELASAPAGGAGSTSAQRLVQPRTLLFGALCLLFSAQAAAADIVNVGFEPGTLDGWVTGNSGNQASGSYSGTGVGASVVTGMTDYASNQGPYSWTVLPYQSYMASLQAGSESSTFTNAATALGLDADSRTSVASTMAGTPTNAAWMYQDLTLTAGSSFTMAWQYVSTDYVPYNDASLTSLVNLDDANVYATINNQAAQYALLGATTPGTGSYSTGSYGATGWQVATYQIADAGTYRLGFMSINLDDTAWSPVLFVDQQPGLTFNFGTPFGPVAPNPGSGAPVTPPPASGPVVIDDVTGTGGLGGATEASFEGGTLVVDNDGDTVSQDFIVDDAGGTIDQNGHTSVFSGTIADAASGQPGGLVIENSGNGGSTTFTGTNTYTGDTTIQSGAALALSGSGSISDSSKVTAEGIFDIAGANAAVDIKSLAGAGQVALGGNDLVLTNSNDTFAGTISGSGGVSLAGGTQVLSGQNTYTGGTTLNGGTLQIDADGNLGDASGGLTFDGGTLKTTGDIDSARDITLAGDGRFDSDAGTTLSNSGDVSGAGGLIKDGEGGLVLTGTLAHGGGTVVNDGTLVLSGQNTYTGGTTLNGGTLQIDADGNLGDASGGLTFDGGGLYATGEVTTNRDIVLNGAGQFGSANGVSLVLGGTVTGAGPLAYRGAGMLVLAGDNTHGGGTIVEGGSVRVDHVRGLGTGALTLDGARFQNGLDLTLTQTLVVRGQSIADIASGTTTTLAGAVDGGAADGCFIKSGLGRLQMTGSAVIAAGTCVTEGTLGVNGVLESRVQVDRAGTLRGTGAVKGTINVDGTLAAGNSPGTLLVEGAITMGAGSTLQVDIDGYGLGDGAGNYSRVVLVGSGSVFSASGTLQPVLRGITGDANNTFVPVVGDMFRIVSGQGGVTGRFDRLVQPTSGLAAGTRFQVHYITGFDIDLYVTPSSYEGFLDASATGNTRQVADALDSLVEAGDAAPLDAQRTELLRSVWAIDGAGLGTALAGMSGERHAQLGATAFHAGAAIASAVTDRLAGVALDGSAATASRNLWVMGSHGESSVDEDGRALGFESRHERLSAGVDLYRSDRGLFGVGVSRSESRLGGVAGLGEIDSSGLMVYGTARVNRVLVDAMASASSDDWRTRRPDALGTTSLEGETSGHSYVASLVARLPFTSAHLRWEPYVRAVWQNVGYDAFQDTGNALTALSTERYDDAGSRISTGVRIGSLALDPLGARFTYRAGFAAGAQYGEFRGVTTAHRLGGEFLQAGSPDEGRGFVSFDLGGTWRVSERTYLFGDVDLETSRNRSGHTVNAGIRIAL